MILFVLAAFYMTKTFCFVFGDLFVCLFLFRDRGSLAVNSQSTLRIRAAAALGAMLQLVHERQSTPKYYRFVLDKVEEGTSIFHFFTF